MKQQKLVHVGVQMPAALKRKIRARANKAKMTISAYIRQLLAQL